MKRYSSIILSIVALGAVIIGANIWLTTFYRSMANFTSPLADEPLPAQTIELPDKSRVVLVIISGLGSAAADELTMPNFAQIAQTGASAVIQSAPPSYSQTAGVGLITGAPPETNGAPPVDWLAEGRSLIGIDTVFARAGAANLSAALLGSPYWRNLLPRNHLNETFFIDAPGPEGDQRIFETAQLLLQNDAVDLLVIQFAQLKTAAAAQDATAVQQAAAQIDRYLGQIHQTVDLGSTVLVILGDHGLTAAGGFGGSEPEVTRQPLLLTGSAIVPGSYSDVSQTDVAPTLTTLLGVAAPSASQGRILFEMLRLDDAGKTASQIALAEQRVALAEVYVSKITGGAESVPPSLLDDLAQAEAALDQNNASGAFQLALLAQQHADTQMALTRSSSISGAQWPRLAAAGFVLLLWTVMMWRRRGYYVSVIVIAALLAVGLYHALYRLQGFEYSISSLSLLGDLSALPYFIARRITVSFLAGGGLILILLMLLGEADWVKLLGVGYGFSVLVTYIFALPLFWAFWQNGLSVTWHLPDVDVLFWQITGLYETMIAAILGLFLPWPIMLLVVFVNLIRRAFNKPQSQPEPDALPGLHL